MGYLDLTQTVLRPEKSPSMREDFKTEIHKDKVVIQTVSLSFFIARY